MDKKEAFDMLLRAFIGEASGILRKGMHVVLFVVTAKVIFSMQGMPDSEIILV